MSNKRMSNKGPGETMQNDRKIISRRTILAAGAGMTALPLVSGMAQAQTAAAETVTTRDIAQQLPLKTYGLEHIGTVVPDVTQAAKFYSRVFNPAIYKEQKPPLRYYVTLDPGYIALGARDGEDKAFIDHDCALLPVYNRAAMNARLEQEGLPAGRYGVIPDPDGLGLQLLGAPGGLASSTEPAEPVVNEPPLLRPRGLSHVVRYCSNITASAAFYRKFFGPEDKGGGPEGYTFHAAKTRWVLQPVPAGEAPRIDRFGVHVAPFDVTATAKAIEGLGGSIIASGEGYLHFKGPEGLAVEVKAVDPARIWGLG